MEIYGWAIGNTNGREKEMAKAAVNRTVGRTCSALTFQIMQFSGLCVCVCVEIRFSFCIGISFSPQLKLSWEKKTTTHRNSLMTFVSNFYPLDKFLLHRCRRRRRHLPELNDSSMNCFVRWLTKYSALVYTHSKRITQFPLCSLFFLTKTRKKTFRFISDVKHFRVETFRRQNQNIALASMTHQNCLVDNSTDIKFYNLPIQLPKSSENPPLKFNNCTEHRKKSVPCRGLERDRQNV